MPILTCSPTKDRLGYALAAISLASIVSLQLLTTGRANRPYWEAAEYVRMAASLDAFSHQAPMAYRLLPAKIVALLPLPVEAGFELLNVALLVGTFLALYTWIVRFNSRRIVALFGVALFSATYTIKGLLWWHYSTDVTGWVIELLALIAGESGRLAVVTGLAMVGSLAREITPLVLAVPIRATMRHPSVRGWLGIGAALALVFALRLALVVWIPVADNYFFAATACRWLRYHLLDPKQLLRLLTLPTALFGMLLWPILLDLRGTLAHLRARPDLSFLGLGLVAAGIAGGSALDRLVFAVFPVVVWLFATSARLPSSLFGWAVLVGGQILIMGTFLPVNADSILTHSVMFTPSPVAFAIRQVLMFLPLGLLFLLVESLHKVRSDG